MSSLNSKVKKASIFSAIGDTFSNVVNHEDFAKQIGTGLSKGIDNATGGLAGYAYDAFMKNRSLKKGLARIAENPMIESGYKDLSLMSDLGFRAGDFKDLQELKNKAMESHLLQHDLDKSNTFMGRMSRSTLGQFMGPLATATAAGVGASMSVGAGNIASAMNIGNPLTDTILKRNLEEAIRLNPTLAGFNKALLLDYYKIIYNHAPRTVASNPRLVAGLLESFVNFNQINPEVLKQLSDLEKASQEPLKSKMDLMNMGNNLFNKK